MLTKIFSFLQFCRFFSKGDLEKGETWRLRKLIARLTNITIKEIIYYIIITEKKSQTFKGGIRILDATVLQARKTTLSVSLHV